MSCDAALSALSSVGDRHRHLGVDVELGGAQSERLLGEVRRCTKVIGRFPGETSCLTLVWAVLDLFFSHASNGAALTDLDRRHLYRIKYQAADVTPADEEVPAA